MASSELDELRHERDQYASAINHLITAIRHTAYVWTTTLPDTIRTADVAQVLNDFARQIPAPPEGLRNDLWQKIVAAYYVVFENDGHPEDSKAAADAAMRVVQPELDRLRAELERAQKLADAYKEGAAMAAKKFHVEIEMLRNALAALDGNRS